MSRDNAASELNLSQTQQQNAGVKTKAEDDKYKDQMIARMRPERVSERGAVDILGSKAVQEKISSGMTSKEFVKKLEVL